MSSRSQKAGSVAPQNSGPAVSPITVRPTSPLIPLNAEEGDKQNPLMDRVQYLEKENARLKFEARTSQEEVKLLQQILALRQSPPNPRGIYDSDESINETFTEKFHEEVVDTIARLTARIETLKQGIENDDSNAHGDENVASGSNDLEMSTAKRTRVDSSKPEHTGPNWNDAHGSAAKITLVSKPRKYPTDESTHKVDEEAEGSCFTACLGGASGEGDESIDDYFD